MSKVARHNITEAKIDPVYEAIAEFKKVKITTNEFHEKEPSLGTPEYKQFETELELVMDAYTKALDAALSTAPVTREGALALIDFAFKEWEIVPNDKLEPEEYNEVQGCDAVLVLEALRSAIPHLA